MSDTIMYVVVGGFPRYHMEDERFSDIYGVFDNQEDARQCFYFYKDGCGDIRIMEVTLNKPLSLGISTYGDDCPPLPHGKGDYYTSFWVVSRYDRELKTICYGVRSNKDAAIKLKNLVSKRFGVDDWDLMVRRYIKLDLERFNFDADTIDKEIEPMRLEKAPYFYRGD